LDSKLTDIKGAHEQKSRPLFQANPLELFRILAENHSDKNAKIGPNLVLQYLKK
jgi:hypothetical protein